MWALSLRPLKEERRDVDGGGRMRAIYGGCTKTGEPVIRETVAGTWANYQQQARFVQVSSALECHPRSEFRTVSSHIRVHVSRSPQRLVSNRVETSPDFLNRIVRHPTNYKRKLYNCPRYRTSCR